MNGTRIREPGIDLLRCLGLLFVNGVHGFLYNGFYYEPQSGAAMAAADGFRWLFFCCNGLFLLITGYLKSAKPFGRGYYRSLAPILVGYVLSCAVSFPIRQFLLGDRMSLAGWLEKLFGFGNYGGYLGRYVGLFLLSPFLNLVLDRLTTPGQLLCLAGTMEAVTALPSATPLPLMPSHWTAMYPATYYVLGAVIRRLQPKLRPVWCLLAAAATAALLTLLTMLSTDGTFGDGFGQGYGGFWVTVMAVWIFLALYRLPVPQRAARCLAWMSGGVMEGYLLSRLLDVWVYDLFPGWHRPGGYPLLFLCCTVPIFCCSLLAGKAVHTLAAALCRRLPCRKC